MKKNANGSALVFSLLVLSMILVAALGVASVSVIEQKNSSATGKSTQAFQAADSAIEMVLKKAVINPAGTTIASLGSCNAGTVTLNSTYNIISGSTVVVTLSKDGANLACTDTLSDAGEIKAVATYGNTTRAISSAVAAGTLTWTSISSFNDGWFSASSPDSPIQYAKDSRTGIVYLRGVLQNSTAKTYGDGGYTVFSLPTSPAGICPPARVNFPAWAYNSGTYLPARVSIYSDCTVRVFSTASQPTLYYSLDGISFSTN